MSEYLPSFIVEPVLRSARRISQAQARFNGSDEAVRPGQVPSSAAVLQQPDQATLAAIAAGYLPNVPDFALPDLQRFYPSRFWPSPTVLEARDETTEGTWQSLARNIQLWANQINNLDVLSSPPLDAMPDDAIVDDEPIQLDQRPEQQRTDSETSLNPANSLSTRSRAFAAGDRGHARSEGNLEEQLRTRSEPTIDNLPRRNGSDALPEDDGMGYTRKRIAAIMAGSGTEMEKSKMVHGLMNEKYRRSQTPTQEAQKRLRPERPTSPLSIVSADLTNPPFHFTDSELAPTYAPASPGENKRPSGKRALGCKHYKRNVKLQCFTCSKWYTCRLCHDEVEDHVLPRRDTKHMLCMLCHTPQPVSQTCRSCLVDAGTYYCPICKLWSTDTAKPIYHCDDCGICRIGKGLGKDFFHCHTCAACMSISAETTHRCVDSSTKCDCPICGEFMFTSNKPVAFMRCGHGIHETCFAAWCAANYKCPICLKSIVNMESQFRRLDRTIDDQPMPEEYRETRAYVFCNDCTNRSTVRYHWLGNKCGICESYNTTQLELLGPEQVQAPQLMREQSQIAQELGEAGLNASGQATPADSLVASPMEGVADVTAQGRPISRSIPRPRTADAQIARSPPSSSNSPFLHPHSPTRSARSITPVVGSYFGTSDRNRAEEDARRGSYFSIFAGREPTSPRSEPAQPRTINGEGDVHEDIEEEELDFWGRASPRSQAVEHDVVDSIEIDHGQGSDSASDSSEDSDEEMADEDELGGEEGDRLALPGHR